MNILGISRLTTTAQPLWFAMVSSARAQRNALLARKRDPTFPQMRVAYCLEAGGITPERLEAVAFYEKPLVKAEWLIKTYLVPDWAESLRMRLWK